uniref:Uncharacterized protein n=1 Tax=Macaca fascicularis TaxID=9541 RepID=A0A7N9CYJ3_MACFA
MLSLYPATLLNSLILIVFYWSLRVSVYKVMLSANRKKLMTSFPIWMPFISLSCLIAMARIPGTTLNISGKGGHLCLNLRGKALNFSPLSMMLSLGLPYMVFTVLRYIPPIHNFLKFFSHKSMLNFVKCFLCIY